MKLFVILREICHQTKDYSQITEMRKRRKLQAFALALALMFIGANSASAQTFVVKHNLLYDASLTPNLGFELRLSDKWTAGLNGGFNPFPTDDAKKTKYRHLFVSPEIRRWFCSTFAGSYVGMNAAYSHFNWSNVKFPFGLYPSLKDHRYQGDMVAAGAFYGYSWILSPHWSIEAEIGIDVGYAWFKMYDCEHCGTYYGKDDKPFAMPKAGINIIYNIK